MRKTIVALVIVQTLLIGLGACSPRGELAYGRAPGARDIPVFVGTTRAADADAATGFSGHRSDRLSLARYDVAVPPAHRPGALNVPAPGHAPDPQTDFLIADARLYPTPAAFRAALHTELMRRNGEAVIFVHGYNNTFAEGLYRSAQLGADFGISGTMVHFSWPSQARVMGYAYDHDSALFSRDGLVQLLDEVRQAGARRILLVGHSMGGFLTMEALRQMAIAGDRATLDRIGGVILISPDIDVDVFREQARRIGRLPEPFVVFTSKTDRALGLAAQISGEPVRLGNLSTVEGLSDLKVTMVDTGAFDTQGGHFNVANSPDLINLLRNQQGLARALQGDQAHRHDLFATAALSVRNATQIVLSPIEAIGDALTPN